MEMSLQELARQTLRLAFVIMTLKQLNLHCVWGAIKSSFMQCQRNSYVKLVSSLLILMVMNYL